jgi:NAD(P)-dependent dehydrogenase (short-subunit alcohol dehydrogenase family)
MSASGGGSVVNVGSAFGQVGPDFSLYEGIAPASGLPDYFIHKGGMLQLTRYFASAYGRHAVRVNTLVLGPFRKKQPEELANRFARRTLLQRMGDPAEVKGPLLFLASDASSFVTGSHVVVDGGYTTI